MAATSQNPPQEQVSATQPKLRLRYGRLSVAVIGLLAIMATVVTGILAPFTAVSFGVVLLCFGVGIASFATLRMLAVRDRNQKLLARMEHTRVQALQTPALANTTNRVIARPDRDEQVFDARPGSGRRAPVVTAEELRAEALRVARGDGGVQQPATWEPTEVPKPQYVAVREASQQTMDLVAKQVRPEPLPLAEPLRPSGKISLKASEEAKEIASQVTEAQKAAVGSLNDAAKDTTPAVATVDTSVEPAPAAKSTETKDVSGEPGKPKLNLDAVLQRRRA